MCKTLYIDLPNNRRDLYRGAIAALMHYGFSILRPCVAQTPSGMRLAVWVDHCGGDVSGAASELLRVFPRGSSISIDHTNPFL